MAGKTKAQILDEKLKQKEVENYDQSINIQKLQTLSQVMMTTIPDEDSVNASDEQKWKSAFNDKGRDIIANKIIEIVNKL